VTITRPNVNAAPVALGDAMPVAEGTSCSSMSGREVLANDQDADGVMLIQSILVVIRATAR